MPNDPLDKIPMRMFGYGIVAGMLGFVLAYISDPYGRSGDIQSPVLLLQLLFGLAAFGFWGGITGMSSGIAIVGRIETEFSDDLLNRVQEFRHQVTRRTTAISIIITSPLLFFSFLLIVWNTPIFCACLLLAIAMIVLFSQYTITQYLQETDTRKRKQK